MQTIKIERAVHKGEDRIKLIFPYDDVLIGKVKEIQGNTWSRTMRCWHLPDDPDMVERL